jgi:phenylpropionate dioxygenase-like ring-hydroxylating dioxygenase large terminal subunit
VHADAEIFELELERLFAEAWIVVAHTSELSEPGDYVTRRIGLDPVVVSLGHDGQYRVMLNVCTHRGMKVCRAQAGNARSHTCAFHGWVFTSEGALRGVPFEPVVYGDGLDKQSLGLRQARVGVHAGLIFATWDEDAPGLDEYLGGFAWYLDAMLCRTDAGLEVAGPPQRYVVNANWKVIAEGFFGDAYHVVTVHNRSFADIGLLEPGDDGALYHFKATINGHTVMGVDLERHGIGGEPAEILAMMPPMGMPGDLVGQIEAHLSAEQRSLLATTPPMVTGIFPTTSMLMILGGPAGVTVSLRFFVPLGVDRTEMVSFSLVERDAPAAFKDQVHRQTFGTFGSAGIFETDDVEVWAAVQDGLRGVIGRQTVENYHSVAEPLEDDPARPGTTFRGASSDDSQWLFYERYFEFLEGRA